MKMKFFLPVALLIISLCSCTKSVTNMELLTGGLTGSAKTWVIRGATIDPPYPVSGTTVTNYFPQLPKCQQDDELIFGSDGSYLDMDRGVRCGGPETNAKGRWSFGANEKNLTVGIKTYPIVELTKDKLSFSEQFTDKGVTFTATWVYTP